MTVIIRPTHANAPTQAATADPGLDPTLESAANELWKTLNLARANPSTPRTLTADEDAVFRFYLPFARALAVGQPSGSTQVAAAEQAAEVGLAQAVLAWRYRDSQGFQRFAGLRIQAQLHAEASRRNNLTIKPRRPGPTTPWQPLSTGNETR